MTTIEYKCTKIYSQLNNKYPKSINPGSFVNLENLGIKFKFSPEGREKIARCLVNSESRKKFLERTQDGYDTLSFVHFDTTGTEFLPNGYTYWNCLEEGEYEKIVNTLFNILIKENN